MRKKLEDALRSYDIDDGQEIPKNRPDERPYYLEDHTIAETQQIDNRTRYNIIEEVCYKNESYYITEDGDVYKAKRNLNLPNHPIIDCKKFNYAYMFDEVTHIEKKLEKLILKELKNDNDV